MNLTSGKEYGTRNAEIVAIAEEALLKRQKLPSSFGSEAVKPSYDGLGLPNIAALATHWLCLEAPSLSATVSPPFNPDLLASKVVSDAWQTWLNLAPINHVVLLLMDAFGYDQLRTVMHEKDAPGLAAACNSSQAFFMPATSVFPSATVTGLTSVATAYAPGQHGLVGTSVYMPEIGSVVSLIGWRPSMAPSTTPYSDTQLNPDTLLSMPNIYHRLEEAGVSVDIVNFWQFQATSLSRLTTVSSQAGTTNYIGYHTPADGFARLRDRLQTRDNGKSFTYMYIPDLDTAAHRYGPLSTYYRAEVAALDFTLKRELLEPLAGRNDVVLLLVADHGQLHVHPDRILWLDQHPTLTQLLLFPATGESGARFLNFKQGKETTARSYIQQHLNEHFFPVSKAEAIELGLFGLPGQPLSSECYERIGDIILMPRQDWVCYQHLGPGEPNRRSPVGSHGGLHRAEMLIPFLAYRF